MEALWSAIARQWPLVAPADVFGERFGVDVDALLELGLVGSEPLPDGALYPSMCGERRVVHYGAETYAICHCGDGCSDLDVQRRERWRVDGWRLVERLREALSLTGPFECPKPFVPTLVGARNFNGHRVVFGFVARPRWVDPVRLELWLRAFSEPVILLAPEIPSVDSPARLHRDVEWFRLRGHVDLRDAVADATALNGCLPADAHPVLALDPVSRTARILGQTVDLSGQSAMFALLQALPVGEWVSRDALLVELYDDAITPDGRLKTDLSKLEGRLRSAVYRTRRQLKAHLDITSITVEGEVGYRLTLRDHQKGEDARRGTA